ncbi:hypothetical protein MHI43_07600 [Paenibacillus sp. FSL H8-0457]|uniref:hypothetical protein n=1 Tax=Paenibacillus TaxID=44249 RepID=UPI0003E1EEDA|nr:MULTISPECIES: hypothetical protein [Paenibacillus]ETT64164.1 hypothetical protein C172_14665 [Paenibacillus sp. FSL H8-457]MCM3260188.1 hypothetical protein [Paenibacillus lautus]
MKQAEAGSLGLLFVLRGTGLEERKRSELGLYVTANKDLFESAGMMSKSFGNTRNIDYMEQPRYI